MSYPPPDQPQQPYGQPPSYGTTPPAYGTPVYGAVPVPAQSNNLATVSLVLSLLGLLFGFLTAIPGIITGHMALNRIKQNPALESSRGMAMAGLIIGYVLTGLTALCLLAFAGTFLALIGVASQITPIPTP